MTDLNINASLSIDPSTPFCARTYFQGLRAAGVRPYASSHAGRDSSGRWLDDGDANVRAQPWYDWSHKQDPNQKQEGEYVVALLDKHRHTDDDLVMIHLGICDDEIEPEVHRIPAQVLAAKPAEQPVRRPMDC